MTHALPTDYQSYIHLSRYARWDQEKGRRETWPETVDRYVNFFQKRFSDNALMANFDWSEIQNAILSLDVMPSMRCMMTAGKALDLSNVAGYNCSYTNIDRIIAFDEILYVLMNGTGVGFSVERQFVSQLPSLPDSFVKSDKVIVVEDSKQGWAEALRELTTSLWAGEIPTWDVSGVRPAGTPLKTFGGRASGPEPLVELFKFTVHLLTNAATRKLNSIECHDLVCKIADIVVVGGVRRSALISLSNLSDDRMRHAKSGAWWEANGQRRLANNSVCYTEKPEMGAFMHEWLSLYDSKSGERGIFSREASKKQAAKNGRRDPNHHFGTNPCLTADSLLLTTDGLQEIGKLASKENGFLVYNGNGEYKKATAWSTGKKEVFLVTLENGISFKATGNHVFETMEKFFPSESHYSKPVETRVDEIKVGTRVRTFIGDGDWEGFESVSEKTALVYGILHGDGYRHAVRPNDIIISTREAEVIECLADYFKEKFVAEANNHYCIKDARADFEAAGFTLGLLPERKMPKCVFTWSPNLVRSFLSGVYSANGCAQPQYNRISLKGTCLSFIQDAQRLMIALGFPAYITTNAPTTVEWPNGTYTSKESYDLNVASSLNYEKFQREIGFLHAHKSTSVVTHTGRQASRVSPVRSVESIGYEEVFDFNEPETHWGWVNGLKIHNCSEIILRSMQFCNLSEVVVRPTDDRETLARKVALATVLGTFQSSLTDFPYLSEEWARNTKEESLLGVSLTGIMDHDVLGNPDDTDLPELLEYLKGVAVGINEQLAKILGINQSVAITCVKPSGCTTSETEIKTSEGLMSMKTLFEKNGYSFEEIQKLPNQSWLEPTVKTFVLDENNVQQEVTKLFVNGKQLVYAVEFEDGNVYKFTGNHKLKTTVGWKRVDELTILDEILAF